MTAYQETTSNEDIKKSYWWVTHIVKIKRSVRIGIIGSIIIWWAVIIVYAFILFLAQMNEDRELRIDLAKQTRGMARAKQHQEITVDQMGELAGSGKSADLYAFIQNPNKEWRVDFTYQFFADEQPLEERSSFLFPNEQKYVLLLAQSIPSDANIDITITSKKWHKMTMQDERLISERLRFSVSDIKYASPEETSAGYAVPVSSVTFTIKNLSPFFFNEIIVPIVAMADSKVVSVAQIPLYNVKPEEQRTSVVQWFHSFPRPASFYIRPAVNILDAQLR